MIKTRFELESYAKQAVKFVTKGEDSLPTALRHSIKLGETGASPPDDAAASAPGTTLSVAGC